LLCSLQDRLPRTFFDSPSKQTRKLDVDLVEAVERRLALVEDQMSSLKSLFQVQWDMSRQLKQDISSIQSELDAATRDDRLPNAQLLVQMEAICGERDALQHELQDQTTKLEQARMNMLQVERDLGAANTSRSNLSTQVCAHPSAMLHHTQHFSAAIMAY
jgi:chromosome segregation ATPase